MFSADKYRELSANAFTPPSADVGPVHIDAVCVSLILMIFLKIKHLDNSNLLLSQVAWSGDAAQP